MAWLFVAAFAVRVFFAFWLDGYTYFAGLTVGYVRAAQFLAAGEGYVRDAAAFDAINEAQVARERLLEPREYPPRGAGEPVLGHPIGYPAWLAAFFALGVETFMPIRLAQALVDALACLLLAGLARSMLGDSVGAWAGWFYALWPPIAVSSVVLVADALMLPLTVLLVACVWRAAREEERDAPRWRWWGCAALIGAISVHVRPNTLLLPLFFAACAFALAPAGRRWRRGWAVGALSACVFAACLFPWAWRNYRVTGTMVWTTTGAGVGLWQALGERPNPWGIAVDDRAVAAELDALGLAWHSVEADAHFKARFREAVREEPLFYLSTCAIRAGKVILSRHFWGLVPEKTDVSWQDAVKERGAFAGTLEYARRHPRAWAGRMFNLGLQMLDGLVLLVFVWGAWVMRMSHRRALFVISLPFVYYFLVSPIVHFESRYALPMFVSYAVVGVCGLLDLRARRNSEKKDTHGISTQRHPSPHAAAMSAPHPPRAVSRENFRAWNETMFRKYKPGDYHEHANALVRWIERRRVRAILRLLAPRPGERILEVGCGAGNILDRIPDGDLFGVDLAETGVRQTKARLGARVHAAVSDGMALPFPDACFDKVYCSEVLEHVLEPEKVMAEMRRVTRAGGILVVSTPNDRLIDGLKAVLRATGLSRWVLKEFEGEGGSGYTGEEWHLHEIGKKELRALCAPCGIERKMASIPFPFLPLRYVAALTRR